MNELRMLILLSALVLAAGCQKQTQATASAADTPNSFLPTQAQPTLQTIKLWLGAEELKTELALNTTEQMTGMMFRTNMAENAAMLFVFPTPHRASFWMMNTKLPLSAAYIDPEGTILEIHDLKPFDTNSVTAGSDRIQYVLETNQGWFKRHNVSVGTVLRTERGSLRDSFFKK
jgi:uncharacterized membrane protein (UPF0127 family)